MDRITVSHKNTIEALRCKIASPLQVIRTLEDLGIEPRSPSKPANSSAVTALSFSFLIKVPAHIDLFGWGYGREGNVWGYNFRNCDYRNKDESTQVSVFC